MKKFLVGGFVLLVSGHVQSYALTRMILWWAPGKKVTLDYTLTVDNKAGGNFRR